MLSSSCLEAGTTQAAFIFESRGQEPGFWSWHCHVLAVWIQTNDATVLLYHKIRVWRKGVQVCSVQMKPQNRTQKPGSVCSQLHKFSKHAGHDNGIYAMLPALPCPQSRSSLSPSRVTNIQSRTTYTVPWSSDWALAEDWLHFEEDHCTILGCSAKAAGYWTTARKRKALQASCHPLSTLWMESSKWLGFCGEQVVFISPQKLFRMHENLSPKDLLRAKEHGSCLSK